MLLPTSKLINIMTYRIVKRAFDFVCATIGIIGTFPIWLFCIIAILASDWGPIFYFANRVGKDNKEFKMWKFRSMRVDHSANESSLRPAQDRIFWWGKIMRKLKIDELPQLINIINGTMAIVGPRPAAVDQVNITRGGDNVCVSNLPCGLTSPSSIYDYIYGDKFEIEDEYNEKVLPTRLKLDIWYVNKIETSKFIEACNCDLKYIWWTVIAILSTTFCKYPKWQYDYLINLVK